MPWASFRTRQLARERGPFVNRFSCAEGTEVPKKRVKLSSTRVLRSFARADRMASARGLAVFDSLHHEEVLVGEGEAGIEGGEAGLAAGKAAVGVEHERAGGAVVDDAVAGLRRVGADVEGAGGEGAGSEPAEHGVVEVEMSSATEKSVTSSTLLAASAALKMKASLPLPPVSVLLAALPVSRLLSPLPVPSMAALPVSTRSSTLAPSVKLTLEFTRSVPWFAASIALSAVFCTT